MQRAIVGIAVCCALAVGAIGTGSGVARAQSRQAQNTVFTLDHGWQFRQIVPGVQDTDNGWLPAVVPGDVHLDLLANKKIPDPFESGDTHDWSVSHGRVPFTEYEKHHLRFVSEYDQGAVAGHLAE